MDGQFSETIPNYSAGPDGFIKGRQYEEWVISRWPLCYDKTLTLSRGHIAQLSGETKEGVEIKYDSLFAKTGRLYIEMEEKAREENDHYVLSGIYRRDNSRYYLVGDYKEWWIFRKDKLVEIDKLDPPYLYRPKPTGTSIGFCLPIEKAHELCERYQVFDEDGNPRDDSWLEGL